MFTPLAAAGFAALYNPNFGGNEGTFLGIPINSIHYN
jgi:hypothetical protein